MPNQTVPGNATPAATQGADAATTESASHLAALMGFKELATEPSAGAADAANEHNSQPEAGPVDSDLSQLETASDGAEAEASPATDEAPAEASAEETAPGDGEKTDDELVEGLPRRARKRIDTLTARNKALEAELATLKAKQPEAKADAQVSESAPVVIDNRLEQITDLRELEKVEANSRDTLRAAERALDTVDDLRDQLDLDPEQVVNQLKAAKYEPPEDREGLVKFLGEIKRNIRSERAKAANQLDAIPRRRTHLQQEAQVIDAAAVDYPWLKTREGEDWQLFDQVVKARPQVKLLGPDWPAIVAVQIEGHKSLNARRAAKAKAAPVAAKAAAAPPKQPSRSTPPRPAAGSAARSRFEQTARIEDLARLMPA
jgi:hypothetical protein